MFISGINNNKTFNNNKKIPTINTQNNIVAMANTILKDISSIWSI